MKQAPIYPKNPKAQNGYDNGVIDVAFQLFSCGMVYSGNLTSKAGRDYLVMNGFAVQYNGMHAMTGKGTWAFLRHPRTWISAYRRWRLCGDSHLSADEYRVKRAMT